MHQLLRTVLSIAFFLLSVAHPASTAADSTSRSRVRTLSYIDAVHNVFGGLGVKNSYQGLPDGASYAYVAVGAATAVPLSAAQVWAYREHVRGMIAHATSAYLTHGFPGDEVMPLSCAPRRWNVRGRGTLDDACGGFALTLVDSLPTLALVGEAAAFRCASALVIRRVRLDANANVSVFEANIRVLGGLLSAHLLASDAVTGPYSAAAHAAAAAAADVTTATSPTGESVSESLFSGAGAWCPVACPVPCLDSYNGELLAMAEELALRLLPAFDASAGAGLAGTGLPYHLVSLKSGAVPATARETCTAAAGTFLLEWGVLSRLTGRPLYHDVARRATSALWARRSPSSGLVGSALDAGTGAWRASHTGIGAGVDSFAEYLLKSCLALDDDSLCAAAAAHASAVSRYALAAGVHTDVSLADGRPAGGRVAVSALQAFYPGLEVLAGHVTEARAHALPLLALWRKYSRGGGLPEVYDVGAAAPPAFARDAPLRPELLESLSHLYAATGDPALLRDIADIIDALDATSRVPCGFAAVADVESADGSSGVVGGSGKESSSTPRASAARLDDRMDSYVVAETLQYAFLAFDGALRRWGAVTARSSNRSSLLVFDGEAALPKQEPPARQPEASLAACRNILLEAAALCPATFGRRLPLLGFRPRTGAMLESCGGDNNVTSGDDNEFCSAWPSNRWPALQACIVRARAPAAHPLTFVRPVTASGTLPLAHISWCRADARAAAKAVPAEFKSLLRTDSVAAAAAAAAALDGAAADGLLSLSGDGSSFELWPAPQCNCSVDGGALSENADGRQRRQFLELLLGMPSLAWDEDSLLYTTEGHPLPLSHPRLTRGPSESAKSFSSPKHARHDSSAAVGGATSVCAKETGLVDSHGRPVPATDRAGFARARAAALPALFRTRIRSLRNWDGLRRAPLPPQPANTSAWPPPLGDAHDDALSRTRYVLSRGCSSDVGDRGGRNSCRRRRALSIAGGVADERPFTLASTCALWRLKPALPLAAPIPFVLPLPLSSALPAQKDGAPATAASLVARRWAEALPAAAVSPDLLLANAPDFDMAVAPAVRDVIAHKAAAASAADAHPAIISEPQVRAPVLGDSLLRKLAALFPSVASRPTSTTQPRSPWVAATEMHLASWLTAVTRSAAAPTLLRQLMALPRTHAWRLAQARGRFMRDGGGGSGVVEAADLGHNMHTSDVCSASMHGLDAASSTAARACEPGDPGAALRRVLVAVAYSPLRILEDIALATQRAHCVLFRVLRDFAEVGNVDTGREGAAARAGHTESSALIADAVRTCDDAAAAEAVAKVTAAVVSVSPPPKPLFVPRAASFSLPLSAQAEPRLHRLFQSDSHAPLSLALSALENYLRWAPEPPSPSFSPPPTSATLSSSHDAASAPARLPVRFRPSLRFSRAAAAGLFGSDSLSSGLPFQTGLLCHANYEDENEFRAQAVELCSTDSSAAPSFSCGRWNAVALFSPVHLLASLNAHEAVASALPCASVPPPPSPPKLPADKSLFSVSGARLLAALSVSLSRLALGAAALPATEAVGALELALPLASLPAQVSQLALSCDPFSAGCQVAVSVDQGLSGLGWTDTSSSVAAPLPWLNHSDSVTAASGIDGDDMPGDKVICADALFHGSKDTNALSTVDISVADALASASAGEAAVSSKESRTPGEAIVLIVRTYGVDSDMTHVSTVSPSHDTVPERNWESLTCVGAGCGGGDVTSDWLSGTLILPALPPAQPSAINNLRPLQRSALVLPASPARFGPALTRLGLPLAVLVLADPPSACPGGSTNGGVRLTLSPSVSALREALPANYRRTARLLLPHFVPVAALALRGGCTFAEKARAATAAGADALIVVDAAGEVEGAGASGWHARFFSMAGDGDGDGFTQNDDDSDAGSDAGDKAGHESVRDDKVRIPVAFVAGAQARALLSASQLSRFDDSAGSPLSFSDIAALQRGASNGGGPPLIMRALLTVGFHAHAVSAGIVSSTPVCTSLRAPLLDLSSPVANGADVDAAAPVAAAEATVSAIERADAFFRSHAGSSAAAAHTRLTALGFTPRAAAIAPTPRLLAWYACAPRPVTVIEAVIGALFAEG